MANYIAIAFGHGPFDHISSKRPDMVDLCQFIHVTPDAYSPHIVDRKYSPPAATSIAEHQQADDS
jgi:hypothetical protein